jgi:AraC-like DNA-binding protein
MHRTDHPCGVARHIFNAAIRPAQWQPALDAMVDLFHADHAMIVIHNTASRHDVVVARSTGIDETDFRRFLTPEAARWAAPFRASIPDATAVAWSQLVPERTFKRSAFYNEIVRPANGLYAMTLRYELPAFSASLAICRRQRSGDFAAGDIINLQMLLPHLASSLQFHARLHAHEARDAVLAAIYDNAKDTTSALRQGPAAHLLSGYMQALASLGTAPSAELSHFIGLHLVDLIDAAIRPTMDGGDISAGGGCKLEQQHAVLAEIARRCGNPALDVDAVALRLGLSRRSVQRLLEQTGKSFVEHVSEYRLQRAYAMLGDPRCAHLRIIDVASASGFRDVSNFNRVFRRRFGNTPSQVRTHSARPGRLGP